MKLSANFTLSELTKSQTAIRHGIPNEPNADQIDNLKQLCINILQPIRSEFDKPVIISSAFRTAELCLRLGSSINSQHTATNGAAASVDNLIDLKGEVAVDSADQATAGFLINAKVEKALSKLKDSDNRYLLDPYASYLGEASLCGRRVVTSNNVPSNLTKGSGSNLSAIIYGDFSQLMIAMFSNVEVLVDPYSDFASGKVGIRALASFDIGIRQPSAFAAIVDAVA